MYSQNFGFGWLVGGEKMSQYQAIWYLQKSTFDIGIASLLINGSTFWAGFDKFNDLGTHDHMS